MTGWLIALLMMVAGWLIGWSLCRAAARADADEAQRELLALLAELADNRTIADNLDV